MGYMDAGGKVLNELAPIAAGNPKRAKYIKCALDALRGVVK